MNRTLLLMWSIRRSGTHLIRTWLGKQFDGSQHHIPNAKYGVMAKREAEGELLLKPYETLIISFEQQSLETAWNIEDQNLFQNSVGSYDEYWKIMILRDPWNLFASRRKHRMRLRKPDDDLWAEYARAFVEKPHDAEYVLYHEFLTKITARRRLSKAVGGKFDDSAVDRVPSCCGGSSFDGMDYDGRGREMDIFGRWREYWEEPSYRKLFTDEVKELAKEIFGTANPETFERKMKKKMERKEKK